MIDVPRSISDQLLAGAEVEAVRPGDGYDGVIAFCSDPAAVAFAADKALPGLMEDGLLWMAYQQKLDGSDGALTPDTGWEPLSDRGWETETSISIDNVWTGIRFRRAT